MTSDDILALRAVAEKATPIDGAWSSWTGQRPLAKFRAAFDPPTVLALLDRLAALEEVAVAAERGRHVGSTHIHNYTGESFDTCGICAALNRLQSSGAGGALPAVESGHSQTGRPRPR